LAQSATKTFPDVGSKRTALGWNIENGPEAAVEDVKFGWPRTLTALWLSTHVVAPDAIPEISRIAMS